MGETSIAGGVQVEVASSGVTPPFTVTAGSTGTATITVQDVSEGTNGPMQTYTYTVVPGSAQATQTIEYNGAPVGPSNPVSLKANTPVELQVVNVDAGANPIDVTGATPLAVGLPSAPVGMQWEVSDGAVGHSELVVEIPAGQSSANVWLVSSGTAQDSTTVSGDTAAYMTSHIGAGALTESTPDPASAGNGVVASWSAPAYGSSTLVGYQIWAIPSGGTPFEVPAADLTTTNSSGLVPATATSTVVKGLTEGQPYWLKVDAVYSTAPGTAVEGPASPEVSNP